MVIIFLEVDGVLCLDGHSLYVNAIADLKIAVAATGAEVCVIGSWRRDARKMELLERAFADAGIRRPHRTGVRSIYGYPELNVVLEICEFLMHAKVQNYVVLTPHAIPCFRCVTSPEKVIPCLKLGG